MAEGTTLERLQVVIEAKAEAYKKEIDAVKAKTEKVTAAVNKCMPWTISLKSGTKNILKSQNPGEKTGQISAHISSSRDPRQKREAG